MYSLLSVLIFSFEQFPRNRTSHFVPLVIRIHAKSRSAGRSKESYFRIISSFIYDFGLFLLKLQEKSIDLFKSLAHILPHVEKVSKIKVLQINQQTLFIYSKKEKKIKIKLL